MALIGEENEMPEEATLARYWESTLRLVRDGAPVAESPAVCHGDLLLTFGQINSLANRLARIVNKEFPTGGTALLWCRQGPERIVATLAAWKTGFAVAPCDNALGDEEIRRMVATLQPSIVFCCADQQENVRQFITASSTTVIVTGDISTASAGTEANLSEDHGSQADTALILYTSGSTGQRKAVPLTHRNLLNRLSWQWQALAFRPGEVGCSKTTFHFVDYWTEAYGCLLDGVPLAIIEKSTVLAPGNFLAIIDRLKVTRLLLVPAYLNILLDYLDNRTDITKASLRHLKLVMSSGEKLPFDLAMKFFHQFPQGCALLNLYGCTELTGDVTFQLFNSMQEVQRYSVDQKLSIGSPIFNTNVRLMTEKGELVEDGETGQLQVAGENVMKGYLFGEDECSDLWYHTGDYCRIVDDMLIYEGRKDTMVKIRGQRTNLQDIEQALLLRCPSVQHVKVQCINLTGDSELSTDTRLVAFYSLYSGEKLSRRDVTAVCAENLPDFMVPDFFEVDEFPLQPNTGKTDLGKLKELYMRAQERDNAIPKTPFTSSLAKALSIDVDQLSLDRSFFDQGGNSLSAVTALSYLRQIGIDVSYEAFASCKRLKDLGENSPPAGTYEIKVILLNDLPFCKHDALIKDIAESFVTTNPLDMMNKTSIDTFVAMIKELWALFLAERLSLVAVNPTGEVLGASLSLDLRTEIDLNVEISPVVIQINEDVENPVKERLLLSGGRWVDFKFLNVSPRISPNEAARVMFKLEQEMIEFCRSRSFTGILTVNSHCVTQEMEEHLFGYEVKNRLNVREWKYKGKSPFSEAPKDFELRTLVKLL